MQIPLVDLKAQYALIKPEIDGAIQRILNNTSFILGKEVADFEQEFADFVEAQGAVGVGSGTAALHLALLACGVGPGSDVITVSHTFTATSEAILNVGARPIFVDIDPKTFNIDANQAESAITPRTKAILPVHLYGFPSDMDPLLDIAQRHNLYVIEDAAQAHGAEYKGKRCGSLGNLACFSFYPGKNLGAYGDAGMVTGNDEALLSKVRLLRDHGRSTKYEHEEIGWGERLDALQAAILSVKLKHLETWTEARRAHAQEYTYQLAGMEVVTPMSSPDVRHVYHLYVIRTERRDALLSYLNKKGISAGIHYPIPLHKQPAYLKIGYSGVRLPVTEEVAGDILSLPMYPELTNEQITYVTHGIEEFLG